MAILMKGEATLEEGALVAGANPSSGRVSFKVGEHVIMLSDMEAIELADYCFYRTPAKEEATKPEEPEEPVVRVFIVDTVNGSEQVKCAGWAVSKGILLLYAKEGGNQKTITAYSPRYWLSVREVAASRFGVKGESE